MTRGIALGTLIWALAAAAPARAADLVVEIRDGAARPVENAVVSLTPNASGAAIPDTKLPAEAVIDQKNETFLPLVTVLRPGGHVTFLNSDKVRHHIYSFSTAKQFQLVLNPGDRSPEIVFDRAGVAAIGCNIHDHMVTYVYAAESPWTALTAGDGKVTFKSPPPGTYIVRVWHPSLMPGAKPPEQTVELPSAPGNVSLTVSLLSRVNKSPHQSHDY